MDDSFTFHAYSCALCKNRVNLSEACCCKDSEAGLYEVTDERLIKRANLQPGDKVCAQHLEKLKSGMIFGNRSACCSPFHVEASPGRRLRSVPRAWRSYFDSPEFSPRYMSSLQICDACYNITLDLLFDGANGSGEEEYSSSDYLVTSPTSRYLNPRRWISSHSLHNLDSNSESSSSCWSLASPRRNKPNQNLLSLYAKRREKYGHPKVIPPSVRRYLQSGADATDVSDSSSIKMSRQASETDSQSVASSFYDQGDVNETPKGPKSLVKRASTRTMLLEVDEVNGLEESKDSTVKFKAEELDEAPVFEPGISEPVNAVANENVVDADGKKDTMQGQNQHENTPGEIDVQIDGGLKIEKGNFAEVAVQTTDVFLKEEKCETHDYVTLHAAAGELKSTPEPQSDTSTATVNHALTRSMNTPGQVSPQVDRLSHSLANEIVFFVLSYFSTSNTKDRALAAEGDRKNKVNESLQVFANTLAISIVNFVVDESRRQVYGDEPVKSLCKTTRQDLENFGSSLADVILSDVGVTIGELNACRECQGKILRHCESVVHFAHNEAERIMSSALATFRSPRLKLQREKLASEVVDKAISSALLAVKFEKKEENGSTEVEWIENKQCYRTVFTIAVGDAAEDKISEQGNVEIKEKLPTIIPPKIHVDECVSVECYVDELVPVTRSLSNGFIDRIGNDDAEDLSKANLRKAVSNDSIFLMVCEPVGATDAANGEELLVQNLNANPVPKIGNGGFIQKGKKTDVEALSVYRKNGDEHMADDCTANGFLASSEDDHFGHGFKDDEPIEIVTFYPSSMEEDTSSDDSMSSSSSSTRSIEVVTSYHLNEIQKNFQEFETDPVVEAAASEKSSAQVLTKSPADEIIIDDPAKTTVDERISAVDVEECSVEQNGNISELAVDEPNVVEIAEVKNTGEEEHAAPNMKSHSFDEKPKAREVESEQTETNKRRIKKEIVDVLPDITRSVHRRRTMQFSRAVSDAEIIRNRCRSEMLSKRAPKKSEKKSNKENTEPLDTSDVFCSSIEDATPPILKRVPSRKEQENEAENSRSRVFWRAMTLVGMLGVILYTGWKYYYST